MWDNKMKALTLSYDDGVLQDKRFVEILNKYGIKCTFNINSGMLYNECLWGNESVEIRRMTLDECKKTFLGHEIAGHSLTHPDLRQLDDYHIERQIAGDKVNIENLFGCEVTGFALPGGMKDVRVEKICRNFGIKYVRNIGESENFELQKNLYDLTPTVRHSNPKLFELLNDFLKLKTDTLKLFYMWGHSYEFDINNNWEILEEFCKKAAGRDDIFYGTNYEVLKHLWVE